MTGSLSAAMASLRDSRGLLRDEASARVLRVCAGGWVGVCGGGGGEHRILWVVERVVGMSNSQTNARTYTHTAAHTGAPAVLLLLLLLLLLLVFFGQELPRQPGALP
jgi:hypothetical protein